MGAVNDPTPAPADFIRDQWQRPLVVPAGGDRPRPYTRASSAAKTIEDTYNLEMWARRNVAFGMARDPSLIARVLAVGGDPGTWDQSAKREVDRIHADAGTVAQAHKGADIGTAVHRLTEMLDRGISVVAGPYADDLTAYTNALIAAGLTTDAEYVECRLACDALEMAGTADRLVRRADGRWFVADIKTGATIDYGALGWSAQLAAYAHSDLYDPTTTSRKPTPALDKTVGIIIHLPAGQGVCTLYQLDLVAGYRAAQMANEVRNIRREARRWIGPMPAVEQAVELVDDHEGEPLDDERYAKVRARHDALPDHWQFWAGAIAAEANQAGVPFYLNKARTFRRYWIYAALILLAEDESDSEVVRALVARATDSDGPLFPTVTVGHAVGAMGAAEARRFCDAAAALKRGELECDFSGPAMRLVPI